ncbi:hypothetical protein Ancab_003958 [Ancistrocladus abbreviatus]
MHRSSAQGGPCSCGLFHSAQCSCFSSMIWPVDDGDMYAMSSSSSTLVDCTLSLGTPSTRKQQPQQQGHDQRSSGGSGTCMPMSNFCWDFWQQANTNCSTKQRTPNNNKSSRGGNSGNNGSRGDPLLARRCANCDTTSTPLWRNGPRGPKSLCNACGIRFKKEERRATAAATATTTTTSTGMMEAHHMTSAGYLNTSSWGGHQTQKLQCFSPTIGNHHQFRFIEDEDDSDAGICDTPFLSWRLNVTDRPNLVHDFTR